MDATTTDAAPCLRPKSEVWIQHELDLAVLNAEKNRSIIVNVEDCARRIQSASRRKKSVLKLSSDVQRIDPNISQKIKSAPSNVRQRPSHKLQDSPTNNQGRQNSDKGVVEEQSTGINSLQTQIQSMINEWSCAIKLAIFQGEMEYENTRHAPQQLVIV